MEEVRNTSWVWKEIRKIVLRSARDSAIRQAVMDHPVTNTAGGKTKNSVRNVSIFYNIVILFVWKIRIVSEIVQLFVFIDLSDNTIRKLSIANTSTCS